MTGGATGSRTIEATAGDAAERRYRCPGCKREVAVFLGAATVSCSRCGRVMKRDRQEPG